MSAALPLPAAAAKGGSDAWRALRMLAYYRWAVALALIGLYASGRAPRVIEEVNAPLFALACLIVAIAAVITSVTLVLRSPRLPWQIYLHVGLDIGSLVWLVYAGGGVASGLGVLLITPVAGAATLTSPRVAALLAAIAALGLLGEEMLRYFEFDTPVAGLTQGGLLGSFVFLATLGANALAQRAKLSEEQVARSTLDLANLAQLNEAIIGRMGMGVLVVDSAQRIRLLNRGAARLLGVSTSLQGGRLSQLAPALAELIRVGLERRTENDAVKVEVGEQQLMCHLLPLKEFVPPAVMVYLEDAARMDEQAQQIKLAALGRLTASIAHEIRNPLGAISHAQQLLSEWENSQEEQTRLLEIIGRHSARINQIVEDVLRLSRRENFTPQTLHLRGCLEELARDFCEEHAELQLRFTFDEVPAALEVRADPQHLRQILHNLWDNAVQHSGQAAVEIRHRGGWRNQSGRPFLELRDNGPGVPDGITDKIFEPFFTTAVQDGIGLGLYIVRELCECNRARVNWLSAAKGGACFRITFAALNEWVA